MKIYAEVKAPRIHNLGTTLPSESTPRIYWIDGCMDQRAGLDVVKHTEISLADTGNRTRIRQFSSL